MLTYNAGAVSIFVDGESLGTIGGITYGPVERVDSDAFAPCSPGKVEVTITLSDGATPALLRLRRILSHAIGWRPCRQLSPKQRRKNKRKAQRRARRENR